MAWAITRRMFLPQTGMADFAVPMNSNYILFVKLKRSRGGN